MMRSVTRWMWVLWVGSVALPAWADEKVSTQSAVSSESVEKECGDRRDNDQDGMVDCADADCYHASICESGQSSENSNAACSDWIDNDGDGFIDCDDSDCLGNGVTRCAGSWGATQSTPAAVAVNDEVPELTGNMQIEDILGKGNDVDGERTDEVCADGIDNDGDGRTDCQDLGCRFDPSVTVCATAPGLRFGAVVMAGLNAYTSAQGDGTRKPNSLDASFSRIQLRAQGAAPFIPNSFILLNARAERAVRLTFALFQVPVGKKGHYFNVNTGAGGLSAQLIQSISRNPFGESAAFAYNFVEQFSGLATEFGGPLLDNRTLVYRVFGAVGAGTVRGTSLGGQEYKNDGDNITYGAGGQIQWNVMGYYDRFTSPMLYTSVPTTLSFYLGGRFDQRPTEQYAAGNLFSVFRTGQLHVSLEAYGKREFIFDSFSTSYVAQANVLVVPRKLLVSAEFAQYSPGVMKKLGTATLTPPRALGEWQARGALHYYVYRNVFLGSLIYKEHHIEKNPDRLTDNVLDRSLELEARVIF